MKSIKTIRASKRRNLTELQTEALTDQREWMVDGIPVLSAEIALPQPIQPEQGIDSTKRRIRHYYRSQNRAFLRYCETWLFPQAASEYQAALAASAPLPHFHAELTYQITYNTGGFWSLYTQSREWTGPAPPFITRHGDTWDLAAGYPVGISAFFPPRSSWKRLLLHTAAEEMQRREAAGVSRYREDWRRQLRRHFNSQNFYLTSEGLTFFYPMCALTSAQAGIPVFTIPFRVLRMQSQEDSTLSNHPEV